MDKADEIEFLEMILYVKKGVKRVHKNVFRDIQKTIRFKNVKAKK